MSDTSCLKTIVCKRACIKRLVVPATRMCSLQHSIYKNTTRALKKYKYCIID